ncbi:MAG: hypothetical protein NTW65_13385 [Deltaproteobacteria bacterium]|nr:hypothetical protein [Deltaproteobacteria bacterium]
MKEVYDRAESLGPDGVKFSKELRNDMQRVFNEAGKPVKYKNDVNIVNLTQSREKSVAGGSGSAERQFIVSVLVSTNDKGEIVMSIESYLSKSADKTDKHANLQSILILDKHGKIIESQISKEVKKCLAR